MNDDSQLEGRDEVATPRNLPAPPWLLRHRLTIPGRSAGYLHRANLLARCKPTVRPLTLLVAPGGFGKTTLLAACCRELRQDGVPVAWLTLDDSDELDTLETYLACAFAESGLDVLKPLGTMGKDSEPRFARAALILRAIEAHDSAIVLALDEAERLTDPAHLALVEFLIRGAPANLHVAIACRELPANLDIAAPVFSSDAQILTASELRFSRDDIDRFFDHALSRPALAKVALTSAGWPIAVRISHNESNGLAPSQARARGDVMSGWVASRLWYNLADDARELLLDVGLLEWFDAALLDEALETRGALDRVLAMRSIDGLLAQADQGEAETWRLHPLIREHCARTRRAETLERFRRVHGNIARALAARGQILVAMQHAAQADDATLVATILLDGGGVWNWLREGPDALVAAERLLSDQLVERHPRLAAVRCAAFAAKGQLAQARRVLSSLPKPPPEAASPDELALYLEQCLAVGMVNGYGCESRVTKEREETAAHLQRLVEGPAVDPIVRSAFHFSRCFQLNLQAQFDQAMEYALRLREPSSHNPILMLSVDVQIGQIAMARGLVADAYASYRKGQRLANATFLENPWFSRVVNIFIRELDLERGCVSVGEAAKTIPRTLRQGSELAAHLAAAEIAVERAGFAGGTLDALSMLEERSARALQDQLPALVRHLAALRVSLLAGAGRANEAKHAYAANGLPMEDEGCVDFRIQSWREAESVTSARISLLIALGEFEAGRRLARAMLRIANERGLRRTVMRMLALCLRLEHRAGDRAAAEGHLTAFLDLFAQTDYSRAMVNEGATAEAIISEFLGSDADAPRSEAAQGLLAAVRAPSATAVPQFSNRELQVLRRLSSDRDDNIAAALGITRYGVRYHVGNLLTKLRAKSRRDAVRRARELGILPVAD